MDEITIVKVRSESRPAAVAGAIAGIYRDQGCVAAQAVGAAAVNQMVKAMAVAIQYLADDGTSAACVPSFETVPGYSEGTEVTALRMTLVKRDGHDDPADEGWEFVRLPKDGAQGA
jgi:stage V sporulation protein S